MVIVLTKRRFKMKDKPKFAEVIQDAKFEVVGAGTMPEGEHFWCSFCGGRGIHFVLLKRLTDNSTWKVGKTCIGRVGLTLPKSVKKVVIKREAEKKSLKVAEKKAEPKSKEKEAEKPKKKETKEPKAEELKKEEVSSEDIENIFEELD